jgi:hypothetical protein
MGENRGGGFENNTYKCLLELDPLSQRLRIEGKDNAGQGK